MSQKLHRNTWGSFTARKTWKAPLKSVFCKPSHLIIIWQPPKWTWSSPSCRPGLVHEAWSGAWDNVPFGVMASGKLTAEDGRLSPWLYLAQPGLIIASTGLTPGRGGPPFGYPKARTVSQFNEETPGPSVRMHRSGPVIARLPKFSSLGWGPRSSPPSLHTTLTSQLFPTEKKRRKVVLQPGIEPALLRRQCR